VNTRPSENVGPSGERAPDPGGVKSGPVMAVALATLLVMGLGVAVAWEIVRRGTEGPNAPRVAGRFDAPPAEMNAIEMSLLASGVPGSRDTPGAGARTPDEPIPQTRVFGLRPAERPVAPERGARAPAATPPAAESQQRLQGYGWSDRGRGMVHIPIARAIELYVAREGKVGHQPGPAAPTPRAPSNERGQP
jgi:hypothetical protein